MKEDKELQMPTHVTIIMDGNGRWAKKQGKVRLFGHNVGVESVRACCEYAVEHGIKYLSLFAFSEENWGRPQAEIDGLMSLMVKSMVAELPVFLKQNVKFRVIGNRTALPADVVEGIEKTESATACNTGLNLIVMLSYSGKWDILQSVQRIAAEAAEHSDVAESIDMDTISSHLVTSGYPDPDLRRLLCRADHTDGALLGQRGSGDDLRDPVSDSRRCVRCMLVFLRRNAYNVHVAGRTAAAALCRLSVHGRSLYAADRRAGGRGTGHRLPYYEPGIRVLPAGRSDLYGTFYNRTRVFRLCGHVCSDSGDAASGSASRSYEEEIIWHTEWSQFPVRRILR